MSLAADAQTARLFLALWPSALVREQLAAHVAQWQWPAGARVYAPDDWHLTLHFIGPVPRERLPQFLHDLHAPLLPFQLQLDQPEAWPQGLAVLTPSEVPPPLIDLHEQLRQRLVAHGLPVEERAFRPHVTLARRAMGAQPPPAPLAVAWPVQGYALVESTPHGPVRYQVLWRHGG
jgi:2'-5' RNA ligase